VNNILRLKKTIISFIIISHSSTLSHALYFSSLCERLLTKRNSAAILFVLLRCKIQQCVNRGLVCRVHPV